MSKLHLHHLEASRSFRILWLLEELQLPYQLTKYERHHGLAPKTLQKVHPLGKAPILQDDQQTLIESANIIEYLIDHYDQHETQQQVQGVEQLVLNKNFRPDYGSDAYEQYRYWLHFTESSLMPMLIIRLVFTTMINKSPLGIKQIAKLLKSGIEKSYVTPSLTEQLNMLDRHLAVNAWLAGNQFTGADIQLEFGINAMAKTGGLSSKYANIHNWLKKCQARPAYQQALEKS